MTLHAKSQGLWAGAVYRLNIEFGEDYPEKPPICRFRPVLFHPNVYPSGRVCLSLLDADKGWKPTITVKQVPRVPVSTSLHQCAIVPWLNIPLHGQWVQMTDRGSKFGQFMSRFSIFAWFEKVVCVWVRQHES